MISNMTKTYVSGDITKIENYEAAINDHTQVWKVFHRNTITGVGRIPKYTLRSIGKYYAVPTNELIFLPKTTIRKLEEDTPMTSKLGWHCSIVFRFWSQLHPNKLFSEITEQEFDELFRSIRRLRILLA